MPKQSVPLNQLESYLPPGSFAFVLEYLQKYRVRLTIAKERKSMLGNYRHKTGNRNHQISVNGNLNPHSFLITLLHELAHLLTFEQYGRGVKAHGPEWKFNFSEILEFFLSKQIFPEDVEEGLKNSLKKPAASSCADEGLYRILRKYDFQKTGFRLIEDIPEESRFRLPDGRVFKKGVKLRKRYKCTELETAKDYLFSPVYEVELL